MGQICIELEKFRNKPSGDGAWNTVEMRRTWAYPDDANGFEEALIDAGCEQLDEDSDATEYTVQVPTKGLHPYTWLLERLRHTPYLGIMPDPPHDEGWLDADVTITIYW